jgi:tetratricopeptide (TPR) repeat protein/TolB-like protein/predicted Ser/Thr protein kinase
MNLTNGDLPKTVAAEPTPCGRNLSGTTVGRFFIRARVGAGGMGEVYRADDPQLRRTVAIKRLSHSSDRELLKEAQRASALNDPHIAAVYDVFAEGDELFLVMEYVDGVTLKQRLQSPLGIDEFYRIAMQCLEALEAAHQKGILHGDLKPANIMLTRDGDVKICDFGLARRVALPGSSGSILNTVTTTGQPGGAGTPGYMAPEVALNQRVDIQADLFSLGVVFYEMLAQKHPFTAGSVMATLARLLHHEPESIESVNPHVPARLGRIVHRMLEKEPSKRQASAAEVARELAAAQKEEIAAGKRRRAIGWVAAALLVTGVAAFAIADGPRLVRRVRSAVSGDALPAPIHLAVLPFAESNPPDNHAFFSAGFTEAVNRRLSRLTLNRPIQVSSSGDVRARQVGSAAEARQQLGANVALTGALSYEQQVVVITCAIVDTRAGRTLRQGSVTADPRDPLVAENRIVEMVVGWLAIDLTDDEQRSLVARETSQPGAYDFFLQASGYLQNYDRPESIDSAITVFRRALEVDGRYALAYAGLGQAYWRKHELTGSSAWVEPARAACEGALGIDPSLAEPHACLGMVLNGTGAYERAAAEYGLALAREPTNDVLYSGAATAYERLGRPDEAEQSYRRAIELRPHYWAGYNMLGAFYYRTARYDDALKMFQQVVDLAPDSFRGYSSLGAVYFMKDRMTEAIDAFQRSLAVRPNYVAASNLGTLLYSEGEYKQSAEMLRQALAMDQGSYQVWANLASALETIGDQSGAEAAYREMRSRVLDRLTVNARDPNLHLALANCHAALGDLAQARSELQSALALKPSDAHTLFTIAAIYEQRFGQRDEALQWLTRSIEQGQTWREIDHAPMFAELRKDPRFQQLRRGR